MSRISKNSWIGLGTFAVFCALIPLVLADQYYMNIAVLTMITIGLCVSWNIVGGISGLFSFAHTIFIALGALMPALLAIHHGVNPWLSLTGAAAVSAIFAVGFAWLGTNFRLNVLTFALVTLGFSELTLLIVTSSRTLGGTTGISILTPLSIGGVSFNDPTRAFVLVAALVVLTILLTMVVLASKFGFYLVAQRDNESAARGLGIPVLKYRSYAMVTSAVLTTMYGGLYAQYVGYVDPYRVASPLFIIEIVLFTTLGGLGTVWGPVLGAALFMPMGELLRAQTGTSIPGVHEILVGFAVILIVSFARTGLVGIIRSWELQTTIGSRFSRDSVEENSGKG